MFSQRNVSVLVLAFSLSAHNLNAAAQDQIVVRAGDGENLAEIKSVQRTPSEFQLSLLFPNRAPDKIVYKDKITCDLIPPVLEAIQLDAKNNWVVEGLRSNGIKAVKDAIISAFPKDVNEEDYRQMMANAAQAAFPKILKNLEPKCQKVEISRQL